MKRFQIAGTLAAAGLGMSIGACADTNTGSEPVGFEIKTAPLTLDGVSNVCYDIRVRHAGSAEAGVTDGFGDQAVVWEKTQICAVTADATGNATSNPGGYGIANGAITYIGTCDADNGGTAPGGVDSAQNIVELKITHMAQGTGALAASGFENPCAAYGSCKAVATCTENQDTRVDFNITVMRQANQGFFDIAVNFEDIFCSAKFDTAYTAGAEASRIKLLFDGTTGRQETGVLAIACTRGQNLADGTSVFLSNVDVVCGGSTVLSIDPSLAEGNHAADSAATFAYALYRGQETNNDVVYWNTAIGFKVTDAGVAAAADCSVRATASAGDLATTATATTFTDAGVYFQAPGSSYPLISVNANVSVGTAYQYVGWALNEVNDNGTPGVTTDDTTPVGTVYASGSPTTALTHSYDGGTITNAAP